LQMSAILFNDGRLANELRDARINTRVIREAERTGLSIVMELRDYSRRHEIDVLHTHKYKDNILGTLVAVPRELPYLVRTIHGAPEPFELAVGASWGWSPSPARIGYCSLAALG